MDFKKKLASKTVTQKLAPVEIYESLDRTSDKGPLRPAQSAVLTEWFLNHKDAKDSIIKLHTGQGKTLVGLLILQSKLNEGKGPVMFVCPNKHLADQTCEQAKQFGIQVCKVDDTHGELPSDFHDCKSILITYIQKAFHGYSKFGIGVRSLNIGAIVLDDSHACIDHIEDSVSIKIPRKSAQYKELLDLFEDDLELQGAAKLEDIRSGEYEVILPIPYWAWHEKYRQVIKIIAKCRDEDYLKFKWPIIQDEIENCRCIISSTQIEITPYRIPIEQFGFYHNSKCRVFMSATTNNDSFFIKGLGISKNTITNPITYSDEKWSGEKMILIPFMMSDQIDRLSIVGKFSKPNPKRQYGIVVLTPSYKAAELWKANEAIIVKPDSINDYISKLKSGYYEDTIVFANRYDGIDLPDNSCRILILDTRPFSQSLLDQYQERCRPESDLIDIKIAQKIEQGLGRAVRGEKDYCVVILATPDIINNVRNRRLKRYFSSQTNKQIEIGLDIARSASEDAETDDAWQQITDLINQSIKRDDGWKEYYSSEMNGISEHHSNYDILDVLELERNAEDDFSNKQYLSAQKSLQLLLDQHIDPLNKHERGWYMQEMARMIYLSNKSESSLMQVNAHKNNRALLRPPTGVEIKRLEMNGSRIQNIRDSISNYENYQELNVAVTKIVTDLNFSMPSEKFEYALFELGKLLGFGSERPDNDWKAGPDNLWNIGKKGYILFECKNEVRSDREEINKHETGQMNNSCAWFKNNYNSEEVKNVMIIATKNISSATGFTEEVEILRKSSLNKLKKNVQSFISELKKLLFE